MDAEIVLLLNSWVGRFDTLDEVMGALVSDYLTPVAGSLVLVALWLHGASLHDRVGNQMTTITGALAVGLANGLVALVNANLFRTRPFEDLELTLLFYRPTDSSFPANAAGVGFALATAVFLRHRKLGSALYALAFLWSGARVFAGVHYPSDIIAGAAIGVLAGLIAAVMVQAAAPLLRGVLRLFRTVYVA